MGQGGPFDDMLAAKAVAAAAASAADLRRRLGEATFKRGSHSRRVANSPISRLFSAAWRLGAQGREAIEKEFSFHLSWLRPPMLLMGLLWKALKSLEDCIFNLIHCFRRRRDKITNGMR